MSSLPVRDQQVIWHPYTQMKTAGLPIAVAKGNGPWLYDEHGNKYLDAISSWWVNLHGHANLYLAEKLYEQAKILEHVIFAGFTHEPAVRLAERLLPLLPGNFSRIFYSDNGSTAVEVALKMCIQFWKNRESDESQRKTIVALKNSYHGDTFGAMSVSERRVFTLPFRDYLFEVEFIDLPTEENLQEAKSKIKIQNSKIACFIYEPLVQGAGGMKMYEPSHLNELLKEFHAHGIPCIADEVMTGFYRTGKMFAGEFVDEKADIICLSKGITGGMMAMGATACTSEIYEAFLSDDKSKTLFHGHSYTANPLACAVANASLDLLMEDKCLERIKMIEEMNGSNSVKGKENIKNLRQLGTILAFEVNAGADGYLNNVSRIISEKALQNELIIRPLGNTVYIMPPYCITDEQLERVFAFIEKIGPPEAGH
ncbi:MAG TPA: adenosylmethionine--8-amino-7-oxononanoate transaminase [Chitinophagaceae bacterium]|nr:adenosylmethionine--8-amino-7-oxononanoate transaminase [Chitinophagaceae bacterium]